MRQRDRERETEREIQRETERYRKRGKKREKFRKQGSHRKWYDMEGERRLKEKERAIERGGGGNQRER